MEKLKEPDMDITKLSKKLSIHCKDIYTVGIKLFLKNIRKISISVDTKRCKRCRKTKATVEI